MTKYKPVSCFEVGLIGEIYAHFLPRFLLFIIKVGKANLQSNFQVRFPTIFLN